MNIRFVFLLLFMGSCALGVGGELPEPFNKDWDPEVGLWRRWPGKDAYWIRSNASKLVKAGCYGMLQDIPTDRVLANLRTAQEKEGPDRGNFWWAWENHKITDRNAGFFTILQLLALYHGFGDQLSDQALADLDAMFREALPFFNSRVYPIENSKLRYPNAYYGDAMCLWMLSEYSGSVSPSLTRDMERISRYYLDEHWGWGEHLSDVYQLVTQREIMTMLLWAKQMSPELKDLTVRMMKELMKIDGLYEGGPCTPTIRCYEMEESPRTPQNITRFFVPYADLMNPVLNDDSYQAWLAYRAGLQKQLLPFKRTSPEITVDCYGGLKALSWVDEKWRYGVMTRYPIFKDTNDTGRHGLAWQTMPMAYWHENGDWGYLQWMTEEGGKIRALPGLSRETVQNNKLYRLSDTDPDAYYGLTFGTRHGDALLVYRKIPKLAASWPWVTDRFRLVHPTLKHVQQGMIDGWFRTAFHYEDTVLTVACYPLQENVTCRLDDLPNGSFAEQKGRELHLSASLNVSPEMSADTFRLLWYVRMGTEISSPPHVEDPDRAGVRFPDSTGLYFAETRWEKTD